MTVAITGASGHLGRLTAEFLLAQLDPSEVVLITRSASKLADLAARGADVREASFADPAGLTAALQGVDKVLLISTDQMEGRRELQTSAVKAAVAAGVKHIAYTSVPHPTDDNPALVTPSHKATEDAIRSSGVAWTLLRNNLYAEFQIPAAQAALAGGGQLYTNAADGRTAYVSRVDCARAAAAVLAGEGHENVIYDITGPEALSQSEVAAIIGQLTDAEVTAVQLDDQTLHGGMEASGMPEEVVGVLVSFGVATREGFLGTVSTHVKDLTGQDPVALFDVLSAAKDQLVTVAG
jgi:NAD(P)H dehydrogenase (quinone)